MTKTKTVEHHNFSSKAEAEKSKRNVPKKKGKTTKIRRKNANKKKRTKKSYGYRIIKR
jgi:hypothetical protein